MDNEPESLQRAADNLRQAIRELSKTVAQANNVRAELNELLDKSNTNRKLVRIVAIAAVVNLIIIVAVAVMGIQLNRVVEIQRDSALCPLYGIFIENDTEANRERAIAQGQSLEYRERAFKVIRKSYDALDCEEGLENADK